MLDDGSTNGSYGSWGGSCNGSGSGSGSDLAKQHPKYLVQMDKRGGGGSSVKEVGAGAGKDIFTGTVMGGWGTKTEKEVSTLS